MNPFRRSRPLLGLASLLSVLCSGSSGLAQTSAAEVQGTALSASGLPLAHAVVRLVSNPSTHSFTHSLRYTLMADALGKFSQGGLEPGAYLVMVSTGEKAEALLQSVWLRPRGTTILHLGGPHPGEAGTTAVSRRGLSIQPAKAMLR